MNLMKLFWEIVESNAPKSSPSDTRVKGVVDLSRDQAIAQLICESLELEVDEILKIQEIYELPIPANGSSLAQKLQERRYPKEDAKTSTRTVDLLGRLGKVE